MFATLLIEKSVCYDENLYLSWRLCPVALLRGTLCLEFKGGAKHPHGTPFLAKPFTFARVKMINGEMKKITAKEAGFCSFVSVMICKYFEVNEK